MNGIERKIIQDLVDEIRWCSGSNDFSPEGQAREGWLKGPAQAIERAVEHLKNAPHTITLSEKIAGHWLIEECQSENIYPPCDKPDVQSMVARVAQVVGLKEPVKPQDWPERVCIGEITTDND